MNTLGVILIALSAVVAAPGEQFVFDTPAHDQWQYPYNFTPGLRQVAPLFSSVGNVTYNGFNDRDGCLVVVWNTSTQIPANLPLEAYDVASVIVTLTHDAIPGGPSWKVDLTVDEWYMFDHDNNGVMDGPEVPDPDCGRPIELFGAGFGPAYTLMAWTEFSPFIGARCTDPNDFECDNDPRDPFPFVYQDGTGQVLHVEDSLKGTQNEDAEPPVCGDPEGVCPFTPIPWAIGVPEMYLEQPPPVCGSVPTSNRFGVVFEVDLALSEGRVREYFQNQLRQGRVAVQVTSLKETEVQAGDNPTFITKEGDFPGDKPPTLVIIFTCVPDGDITAEGQVNAADVPGLAECLLGPGAAPVSGLYSSEDCLCAFDFDGDGDVDLLDAAAFTSVFGI